MSKIRAAKGFETLSRQLKFYVVIKVPIRLTTVVSDIREELSVNGLTRQV